MSKSEKAFRNISEVSEWLATPTHVLRFWESKFSQIKPIKRAGGRRYYRPKDMLIIGGIKQLLHIEGHTIKGAKQVFREKGLNYVVGLSKPLMSQDLAGTGSDKETITKVVKPFEKIRKAKLVSVKSEQLNTSSPNVPEQPGLFDFFEAENQKIDPKPIENKTSDVFSTSVLLREIENLNNDQVNKITPIINDMKNLISLWK
ncbi:MAG: MerR family transcriptional regulator [Rhodobacterales bacterium]|nr:MerR family transcriptional regulator [Rhodobacterales bacterium]